MTCAAAVLCRMSKAICANLREQCGRSGQSKMRAVELCATALTDGSTNANIRLETNTLLFVVREMCVLRFRVCFFRAWFLSCATLFYFPDHFFLRVVIFVPCGTKACVGLHMPYDYKL